MLTRLRLDTVSLHILTFYFLILWPGLLLVGCSGGGSGAPAVRQLSYDGITDPAVIDADNATKLMVGAVSGGFRESALASITRHPNRATTVVPQLDIVAVAHYLKNAVGPFEFVPKSVPGSSSAAISSVHTDSGTKPGTCGGRCTFKISLDGGNGDFWGDMVFVDYCNYGVTFRGTVSFNGNYDLLHGKINAISMGLDMLSCKNHLDHVTLDGQFDIRIDGDTETLEMDCLSCDENNRKTYEISGYTLTSVDHTSHISSTLSGICYHPDYGYVTVETTAPIVMQANQYLPSSGALTATGGAGDMGGGTMGKLTILDGDSFRIEADTAGDGAFGWQSPVLYWADM